MAGLFGIVFRTRDGVDDGTWSALIDCAGLQPDDLKDAFRDRTALLCNAVPGSLQEKTASRIVVCVAGVIHNRQSLAAELNAPAASNTELVHAAYERWGKACVERIYGDWSFALWNPGERELFLARDHGGNTTLYYYLDEKVFAFSTSRRALLAMNLAPAQLNELYLAQVLVSWPAYHGEQTIHSSIKRLPPAHTLSVTPARSDVQRYWRLEDTPELQLPKREDYVEGFRAVFDLAVRERVSGSGAIATTLSGGLDSGAVTATAAMVLRDQGRRLAAYTSVPLTDTGVYVGGNFGDEYPFAAETASKAGNVTLTKIDGASMSPMQAIREVLDFSPEPQHAAGNLFWLLELYRTAAADGNTTLLTGQMGNAGVSWIGDIYSQRLFLQLRRVGLRTWIKRKIKEQLPRRAAMLVRRRRTPANWPGSAIANEFAARLNLREAWFDDEREAPNLPPRSRRFNIIKPGRSIGGTLHAEMAAVTGVRVFDPTCDPRVLSFSISVPDRVFIDPETGIDRWLIREAMKDRLPDSVRLNRRRGRQAGDLVPRLRSCASEVDAALAEIEAGAASRYLDVAYMRSVWKLIQSDDTPQAFRLAITVLTRGIMAGLFVNGFGKTW